MAAIWLLRGFLLSFLFGFTAGHDASEADCFGSTVFRTDDPAAFREFKGDTGNCTEFRWEFELEKPANLKDLVLLFFHELRLSGDARLDVYDFIIVNGTRRMVHRARTTILPMPPLVNAREAGMLVVFEKKSGPPDIRSVFNAEFIFHQNKTFQCPYPFLTATADAGTLYFNGHPDLACSIQINASDPHANIILEANVSNVNTMVWQTRLPTGDNDHLGAVFRGFRKWDTSLDSITVDLISKRYFPQYARLRYYQEKTDSCKCFPEKITIGLDRPFFLTPPTTSDGKLCRLMECETTVELVANAGSEVNLQLRSSSGDRFKDLRLVGSVERILKVMESQAFGGIYSPIKRQLKLSYKSNEEPAAFNLTIMAVVMPIECECSEIDEDAKHIYIDMPSGCPLIDCEWKIAPAASAGETFDRFIQTTNLLGPKDMLTYCFEVSTSNCIHFSRRIGNLTFGGRADWGLNATLWWHRSCDSDDPTDGCAGPASMALTHQIVRECKCPFSDRTQAGWNLWNVTVVEPLTFTSPAFPDKYCPNMMCRVRFIAPIGMHIRLQLHSLDLEPPHDRLILLDGAEILTGKHLESFTGDLIESGAVESTQQVMTVIFTSDIAIAYGGFNATVDSVDDDVEDLPAASSSSSAVLWCVVVLLLLAPAVTAAIVLARRRLRWQGVGITNPILFFNEPNSNSYIINDSMVR